MSNTCTCVIATLVDYGDQVIRDQLVRGIADQEILADLLGELPFRDREHQVTGWAGAARARCPDHRGRRERERLCPARNTSC